MMNIPMIAVTTAIGASAGAALGYFGKCTSGACPLTANPWRGAFIGGLMAALFALSSSHASDSRVAKSDNTVPHINGRSQFKTQVLDSRVPVLVDFYANWCGPCQAIAPTITRLHRQYPPERMKVIKVDVDDNRAVARKYGVRGIPHLMVFKNGEIIASQTGMISENKLVGWIETVLDKSNSTDEKE